MNVKGDCLNCLYKFSNYLFLFQEAREARDQLAKHTDDTVDLQEAVEMATLDKEMAEEKVCLLTIINITQ